MLPRKISVVVVGVLLVCCAAAQALTMDTVPVGNPENAGELSGAGAGGYGPDRICGAVSYSYKVGTYEVTAGQYAEFLNKVAGVDTYGLYNTSMWSDSYGCKIARSGGGTVGNPYTYSVASNFTNRPVNYVSYWDSCRFANWLHNGQGSGDTETGAYTLTTDGMNNNTVARNANWKWAVTSEDEWYKAAYHKNDGMTGNYWDYPTSSNSAPSNVLINPDPGNNANFYQSDYTIGSPYYRTEVGEFENSDSPYSTFDQGGNVWEWNEAVLGSYRGMRGGSFGGTGIYLHASFRNYNIPSAEGIFIGFRVVEVPEPASIVMLAFGTMLMLRRGRGRP